MSKRNTTKAHTENPDAGLRPISLSDAEALPVGSILALPHSGGFSGAFVIVRPAHAFRNSQVDHDPLDAPSIEEWIEAELADEVYLVYLGRGHVPSRSTLNRHWDKFAKAFIKAWRIRHEEH